MKKLFFIFIFLTAQQSFSFTEKKDKISKDEKKSLSQIKLQKGSVIVMDQFLDKKNGGVQVDGYELKFRCLRNKKKKASDCKLIEYDIQNAEKR